MFSTEHVRYHLSKQIVVRTSAAEDDFVIGDDVDEEPIETNVALPMSEPLALEFVRATVDP